MICPIYCIYDYIITFPVARFDVQHMVVFGLWMYGGVFQLCEDRQPKMFEMEMFGVFWCWVVTGLQLTKMSRKSARL